MNMSLTQSWGWAPRTGPNLELYDNWRFVTKDGFCLRLAFLKLQMYQHILYLCHVYNNIYTGSTTIGMTWGTQRNVLVCKNNSYKGQSLSNSTKHVLQPGLSSSAIVTVLCDEDLGCATKQNKNKTLFCKIH